DAQGAQAIADRLHVLNYPSVLLLDANGSERVRFPGGISAKQFCRVLDLAVRNRSGLGRLVERAARGTTLSAAEYEFLAWHWWGIDDRHIRGAARAPFLLQLFEQCPPARTDVKFRLLAHWLAAR